MHQFPQPWVFHNPLSLSQQKARGFWRMKHARTYSDDPAAARRVACFARQRGGGGATSWPRCRGPCCDRLRTHSGDPLELCPATLLPALSGATSAHRRAVACNHARPHRRTGRSGCRRRRRLRAASADPLRSACRHQGALRIHRSEPASARHHDDLAGNRSHGYRGRAHFA